MLDDRIGRLKLRENVILGGNEMFDGRISTDMVYISDKTQWIVNLLVKFIGV